MRFLRLLILLALLAPFPTSRAVYAGGGGEIAVVSVPENHAHNAHTMHTKE